MRVSARWPLALWLLLSAGAVPAAPPSSPVIKPELSWAEPLVGVVASRQTLDLAPMTEGRLEQVKVSLGDRVEAGRVVAVLEARMLQLDLSMRQARVQAAEAEHSRSGLILQQAKRLLQREQRLRHVTAAEEVEKAEHAVQLAEVDVELAKARLAEAQAQVAIATENLEQTRIRAPFSGTVSELYLHPGMAVSRATPVLRLVREELLLRFAVPESLATSIRPGTEVKVRVTGLEAQVRAVVERLSPELSPTSRHMRAEARLVLTDELRGRLPIGLVVEVVAASVP